MARDSQMAQKEEPLRIEAQVWLESPERATPATEGIRKREWRTHREFTKYALNHRHKFNSTAAV
jgi:hypothetical protein